MISESELYPDIGMEPAQAGSISSGDNCPGCGKPALDEAARDKKGRYWHFECWEKAAGIIR